MIKINKEKMVEQTWLSPREAELYLKVQEGFSIRKAGKKIGMSEGQATSTWHSINQKAEKSSKTKKILDL